MKDLKSYAGKAQSFASLILAWRPFITNLDGVIYIEDKTTSTKRLEQLLDKAVCPCVHVGWRVPSETKRINCSVYNTDAYLWRGELVETTLDASPWGSGATLRANGVYTHGTLMPSRNKMPNASTPSSAAGKGTNLGIT